MAIAQAYPLGTPKTNDLIVGTSIPAANTNEDPKTVNFPISGIVALAKPYTSYVALLNLSSTDAPVATVVYNDLSSYTFTWTRNSGGEYTLTSTGTPFTENKTVVYINGGSAENNHDIAWERTSTNTIVISTHNSDGKLTNGTFEIKIY
jgi:hypothetical protein